MPPLTPLEDRTLELCTKLVEDVRELGLASSQAADILSKSQANQLVNTPSTLRSLAASLHALDKPLLHLHVEIESGIPLADLGGLAKSAEDTICNLVQAIQSGGFRDTLGCGLSRSIADNLLRIHTEAGRLSEACRILDAQLCPDIRHLTDDEEDDDEEPLNPSVRPALHARLVNKLASGDRQCPICFEEMVNATNTEPVITKCGHVFCQGCIELVIGEQRKCPMCRKGLLYAGLFK